MRPSTHVKNPRTIRATLVTSYAICAVISVATSSFAGKIRYSYDLADRLIAADYGSNRITTFSYDLNGNLLNRATVLATNANLRFPVTSATTSGANAGGSVTYSYTITNQGPNLAIATTFTDPLPFGILPTSANASQGACVIDGRLVACELGLLAPGSAVTVTITAIRAFVGSFTNVATVASAVPDSSPGNNVDTLVVSATQPPFDADGDGMPNWWEQRHNLGFSGGSGSTGNNGPDGNPDGDGARNFDEWLADTGPRDASSFFHVESFSQQSGVTTLEFQSSPIRRYRAQFTPDLNSVFTNFHSFDGTGGMISITHTNISGGLYRLQAEVP